MALILALALTLPLAELHVAFAHAHQGPLAGGDCGSCRALQGNPAALAVVAAAATAPAPVILAVSPEIAAPCRAPAARGGRAPPSMDSLS